MKTPQSFLASGCVAFTEHPRAVKCIGGVIIKTHRCVPEILRKESGRIVKKQKVESGSSGVPREAGWNHLTGREEERMRSHQSAKDDKNSSFTRHRIDQNQLDSEFICKIFCLLVFI